MGTGANATAPSSDVTVGAPAGSPALVSTRRRASSTAFRSVGDNAAPSMRDATRMTGRLVAGGELLDQCGHAGRFGRGRYGYRRLVGAGVLTCEHHQRAGRDGDQHG